MLSHLRLLPLSMSLLSSLLLPAFQFINSVVVCSFSFRFRVCARRSPSTSGFNAFPRTFSLDVIYTLLTERQVSAGRCGSVFNKPPVGTYTNIFPLCVRNAPLVSTLYLVPSENVRRLFSVYLCCNVHVNHQFHIMCNGLLLHSAYISPHSCSRCASARYSASVC